MKFKYFLNAAAILVGYKSQQKTLSYYNMEKITMSSYEQLSLLLERLKEKDKVLVEEIHIITDQITAHRNSRFRDIQALDQSIRERRKYYEWRRTSFFMHNRRSELKTQREKIRVHIRMVSQHLEKLETNFLNFPVFMDLSFAEELTSAF